MTRHLPDGSRALRLEPKPSRGITIYINGTPAGDPRLPLFGCGACGRPLFHGKPDALPRATIACTCGAYNTTHS